MNQLKMVCFAVHVKYIATSIQGSCNRREGVHLNGGVFWTVLVYWEEKWYPNIDYIKFCKVVTGLN